MVPDLDLTAGGICKNGAVNVLTKDLPSSRLGNGCAGNTALAWLEKYNGPELTLTAFEPPYQLIIQVGSWVSSCHAQSTM